MVKKFLFGLSLAVLAWGCDSGEKERLRSQVDSLRTELQTSQQMAQSLQEVGALIDSIDASRNLLRTDVVEGTNYANYSERLKNINEHIRQTEGRIAELEESLKNSKGAASNYAASIKRLRADLESRTQQLAALEEEVEKMLTENATLARTVNERDSVLIVKNDLIQIKEQDIAALETRVEEINTASRMSQADLYFAQAQALETAAARTKFAPRKKKETQREALELYKLSLSLGKEEAQSRIDELMEELS